MHKNATKCNKILSKWCINKHGASKIIDTFETYQTTPAPLLLHLRSASRPEGFRIGLDLKSSPLVTIDGGRMEI
jgi:hypothetical protein